MAKVDSKGRIVLPKEVREDLGITAGTEVEVREEGGRVVVEPEDDPEGILDRMGRLVTEAASERSETKAIDGSVDSAAQRHRDAVRRGADEDAENEVEDPHDG